MKVKPFVMPNPRNGVFEAVSNGFFSRYSNFSEEKRQISQKEFEFIKQSYAYTLFKKELCDKINDLCEFISRHEVQFNCSMLMSVNFLNGKQTSECDYCICGSSHSVFNAMCNNMAVNELIDSVCMIASDLCEEAEWLEDEKSTDQVTN